MKLHSPQFEKALHREIKKAIKASPQLRKEARRVSNRQRIQFKSAPRLVATGFVAYGVWECARVTGHVAGSLALLAMWAMAVALFRGIDLVSTLYDANSAHSFLCLPVTEDVIFRWNRQKFIRKSFFSFFDLAVGFVVLALAIQLPPVKWPALVALIALGGLTIMGLAGWLVLRMPMLVRLLAAIVGIFWVVGFVAAHFISIEKFWRLLDDGGHWISIILPTGWAILPFQLLLPDANWWKLGAVAPAVLIISTIPHTFARLRAAYFSHEVDLPESSDVLPEAMAAAEGPREFEPVRKRVGMTMIEEVVLSRAFLSPTPWAKRGWLEQRLWNWFTPRERTLFEFAFLDAANLSASWKKIYRNLAIGVGLAVVLNFVVSLLAMWVAGICLFVIFCQVLLHSLTRGRIFQKTFCSGFVMPLYAGYPIGYRETAQMLLKYSLVQLPYLLPLVLIVVGLAALVFPRGEYSFLVALGMGLKFIVLLEATRLPLVALAFSAGTNDSTSFRWRTLGLAITFIVLGFGFIGLAFASLMPFPLYAAMFLTLAVLDAYLLYRIYGWFYHRNRFDLMTVPQQQ